MSIRNEYENLGVPPGATVDQIKSRYRELMREHHPDKGGSADRAADLSASYSILCDRRARNLHDRALELTGAVKCPGCDGTGRKTRRRVLVECIDCEGTGWAHVR